jgi:CHAT domain-containing protein
LKSAYLDRAWPLYEQLVGLELDVDPDASRALAYAERIREAAAPAGGAARHEQIDEGTLLLRYVLLPDRLAIWAIDRRGVRLVQQPIHAAALDRTTNLALHRIAARDGRERDPLSALHQALIGPISTEVAGARSLVFLVGGTLARVPFAALVDSRRGRYLVEDHAIGFAPSVAEFLASARRWRDVPPVTRAVIVGNPAFDRGRWTHLEDLPDAEREAREVSSLYPRASLQIGRDATPPAFLEAARRADVVHYAGHALVSEAPGRSSLLFAPPGGGARTGALPLSELAGARWSPRLVVLSACRTGGGWEGRSRNLPSLVRPLIESGVAAVVAARWDIEDASSRALMVRFHEALRRGADPAEALRTAQLALLRAAGGASRAPDSWGGFVAIGGWSSRARDAQEIGERPWRYRSSSVASARSSAGRKATRTRRLPG